MIALALSVRKALLKRVPNVLFAQGAAKARTLVDAKLDLSLAQRGLQPCVLADLAGDGAHLHFDLFAGGFLFPTSEPGVFLLKPIPARNQPFGPNIGITLRRALALYARDKLCSPLRTLQLRHGAQRLRVVPQRR